MGRPLAAIALCLALAAETGCGPIRYTGRVTRTASREVEAARAAGAASLAPYWFTLAVEYLAKAREEAGEGDFQAATRLGDRAAAAARRAAAQSRARAGKGAR
jgi:hypothetical protein